MSSEPSASRKPHVSVVTSGHDVADARLHRQVRALQSAGLRVEVLGLGDAAGGPPGAVVRTWPRPGLVGRATLAARMAAVASGRILLTLDPDSAVAAALVARLLKRWHVVDVHEDYGRLLADRAWARRWGGIPGAVGQGVVQAFQAVARRADLTVVADDHVPPREAHQRLVERNVPSLAMLPAPCPPSGPPRLLYVGDVRESRGVYALIHLAQAAPEVLIDVVGPVSVADAARVEELMRAAGPHTAARVRWHGKRPPAEAWTLAQGAWGGLSLLHNTPAFRDALPSKVYEYLACGLPVITTGLPRAAELVEASGAGVVVPWGDDVQVGQAAAAQVRSWAADPQEHAAMAARAAAAGRELAATEPFTALAQWCVARLGVVAGSDSAGEMDSAEQMAEEMADRAATPPAAVNPAAGPTHSGGAQ